ncbi:Gfo/Idh/MocA family oxidoreductase [Candidatus Bathyarchaeota archaeon]|nr:MAG: Gfo/Idh/MocA family oxidoreductase [Candidatus Bathyarchaeota archaeon]TMI75844.1 MAG: Gfo/Idh/MocA family oxidoreductase [Candidatus Bathyarchaeota archaeon]
MKRVAVGVIGTGFWGENQVRVFRQSRMADLVAICDSNKKRAEEMGTKYSVPWYSDPSKFLRVPELEAVTVCTPTQTHLKVGLQAIEAGKNLFVEKPMTGEERAADRLVNSAKKAGVKLLVGFIERFNPGVRAVKKMLTQKVVGDVIIATGRRVARWPIRIGDVGVVKDTAIHDIDAMRYLLEEEVSAVFAQTGSLRTHSYEDYAEIMLRFKEGTTGFIDANWLTPRKVRTLIITGSDATINLDYITQEITLENSQRLVKPFTPWAEPLKLELENFITTILRDTEEAPSGEDALKAIRVCDAALRSGKSKTLVTLNAN